MTYIMAGAVVVFYVDALVHTFRRGRDDSSWEARWSELDSSDRQRIADASYSSSGFAELDPDEAMLADGLRHRLNRRSAYRSLAVFPLLIILAALTLGGVVEGVLFSLTSAAAIFWISLPLSRRVKAARRRRARPVQTEVA
jgi:hypothetical protein